MKLIFSMRCLIYYIAYETAKSITVAFMSVPKLSSELRKPTSTITIGRRLPKDVLNYIIIQAIPEVCKATGMTS